MLIIDANNRCTNAIDQLVKQLQLPETGSHSLCLADYLTAHSSCCVEQLSARLKTKVDTARLTHLSQAQRWLDYMEFVYKKSDNPFCEAYYWRAYGNVSNSRGELEEAIEHCNKAASIYSQHNRPVDAMISQIGNVGCLAMLGRYTDALLLGKEMQQIFREEKAWYWLIKLNINLGIIGERQGDPKLALSFYDEAKTLSTDDHTLEIADLENNRATVLRNMARLGEALDAIQHASTIYETLGLDQSLARAKPIHASILIQLGDYTHALDLLNQARMSMHNQSTWSTYEEVLRAQMLIQLGRPNEAINVCQAMYDQSKKAGAREWWQMMMTKAAAQAKLEQYDVALTSLQIAYDGLLQENNTIWMAIVDLSRATIAYQQGLFSVSQQQAEQCAILFDANQLPLQEAQAYFLAARSALTMQRVVVAKQFIKHTLAIGEQNDMPLFKYQARYLLGDLALHSQKREDALTQYQMAVTQLERLREQLMVEFQADFLQDKQGIYDAIVLLYFDLDRPDQAFHYAERAKSQALLSLLSGLDMRLKPRSKADSALWSDIQQLHQLRQSAYSQKVKQLAPSEKFVFDSQLSLKQIEQDIQEKWHELLIRNQAYEQDVALTRVQVEPVQPYLADDTVLLEYFVAQGELILFVVTKDKIETQILKGALPKLSDLNKWLMLNWAAVSGNQSAATSLQAKAETLLMQMYQLLIAPVHTLLHQANYSKLVIVPHGKLLHYLPFHALHDGTSYLIEQFEVGYLPSASVLHYLAKRAEDRQKIETQPTCIAFGYSNRGELMAAAHEAHRVAHIMQGKAYTEDLATVAQFTQLCDTADILHLSTHGAFNPDNPIFSELRLADGSLSTFDIFDLRLRASLVTLSACQTGRHVVKGGDELIGLMRAFLYAGASSLVLCLSQVYQHTTFEFMARFYERLAAGDTKANALRQAQLQFIDANRANTLNPIHAHPYYWAPFFLVGDMGHL